jgi:nitrogen fixation protein FixH
MTRELTGRDVFVVTASAFAVIIAVNVTLAVKAVGTFPGLEVRNSYVASQTFNAEAAAQRALGWQAGTRWDAGRLTVAFEAPDGGPVTLTGLFGRATVRADDRELTFVRGADGQWQAEAPAGRGRWVLHLTAVARDGTPWRQRVMVTVR